MLESPWVLLIRAYILAVLVSFGNMGRHGDRNWPKRWRNTLLSNSLWFDDDDDGGIIHSPMRSYHLLFHQKSFHLSHQVKFPGVSLWELEVLGWFVMIKATVFLSRSWFESEMSPDKKTCIMRLDKNEIILRLGGHIDKLPQEWALSLKLTANSPLKIGKNTPRKREVHRLSPWK